MRCSFAASGETVSKPKTRLSVVYILIDNYWIAATRLKADFCSISYTVVTANIGLCVNICNNVK